MLMKSVVKLWTRRSPLLSVAPGFHFTLHTYPALGYVAVDLYSFEQSLPLTLIMKALRKSFRAEKVKATSVQRGDFGNERDNMMPRRKTKITTLGRVSRTRINSNKQAAN